MTEQHNEEKDLEEIKQDLESRGFQYVMIVGNGSDGRVVQVKKLDEKETIEYAIKILPHRNDDETAKYRKRELDALKANKDFHKNIVKYYEYWTTSLDKRQFLFIKMELCRLNLEAFVYKNEMGGAEIIKAQGPPRFYQHVFPQILEGLYFIHETMGWVHRDLHLSNILIANPNPREISEIIVKIADFGLAREICSIISTSPPLSDALKLEKLSPHVGNKLFRAPELDTQFYDYKVDLYSAGIVLYFLSRYLEDKKQWNDEIKAFRNGKRRSEHLCHQDDKHLVSLIQSLLQEQEKRPTAEEALKTAKKLAETKEHVKSQILVESKRPAEYTNAGSREAQVFVRKDGARASYRCSRKDYTLSSLKAEIERCTGVKAESQVLHQKTTIRGAELIHILSDENVRSMYESADKAGKQIVIIVSDSTDTVNRKAREFRAKKGESVFRRCLTEDDTLSSVQAEIEKRINVKAELQVLNQQTTIDSKDRLIAITSDQDVESMFLSAEKTRNPVHIIVSENSSPNELSTNVGNREAKNFILTKIGECTESERCSIENDTLSSLKAEIERRTGIEADLQVLHQQTTVNSRICQIAIKCDRDVESMFKSAENAGNSVDIFVSELTADAGNHGEKIFYLKKDGECGPLEQCLIKDDALNLSSLKEAIERRIEVKADSQVLCQKTVIDGEHELINITSDQDVQIMFQSTEHRVVIVSQASAARLDMYR